MSQVNALTIINVFSDNAGRGAPHRPFASTFQLRDNNLEQFVPSRVTTCVITSSVVSELE